MKGSSAAKPTTINRTDQVKGACTAVRLHEVSTSACDRAASDLGSIFTRLHINRLNRLMFFY